jgi:hypothetical protein
LAIFESTFKSGTSGGISVSGDRWCAIEIGEGEHEQQDSTGLASSVAGVLADHGISIFCMSLTLSYSYISATPLYVCVGVGMDDDRFINI